MAFHPLVLRARQGKLSVVRPILEDFFTQDPVTCARGLIGCHFAWRGCVGRIVETEAYDSEDDPACHTWFRPSTRAFVERQAAGDAYVYMNRLNARRWHRSCCRSR